jgi:fatty-acyl-CoA synthase
MLPIQLSQRPQTLLDQAQTLYKEFHDQTAVVMLEGDQETAYTYGTFFERAAQYAHALKESGIQPGDLVALILQHGEDVLFSFWGAMLLGAIPSIFPFLTEKLDRDKYFYSVQALVESESIHTIITYDALQPELEKRLSTIDTLKAIVNKDMLAPAGRVEDYLQPQTVKAQDTAFLQHSSGSTGLQKGVMLSHEAVLNQIASYSDAIRLTKDDVIVSWLPLYHDMGLIAGFIMPILQGVKLMLMSPFQWVRDPKILLHAIQRHQGTLCWLPNFAYNFMTTRIRDKDIERLDLSSWRAAINCSEPVYATSHDAFAERFASYGFKREALTVCYAMAENTFAVSQAGIEAPLTHDTVDRFTLMDINQAHPIADDHENAQTFVSNGKPIANCEVQVIDQDNKPLPSRHIGEIIVRSDCMLSGYYARPDLSEDALLEDWYRTGDMGYLADGEIYITGRKKDLIIVGGKNIYPQDIENLLNDIDGLRPGRATAFGIFNDRLGTEDIAIVAEVKDDVDASNREATASIVREVRGRIAQQTDATARYVHLVGPKWLLKTSSGKIARNANRDKFINTVLKK